MPSGPGPGPLAPRNRATSGGVPPVTLGPRSSLPTVGAAAVRPVLPGTFPGLSSPLVASSGRPQPVPERLTHLTPDRVETLLAARSRILAAGKVLARNPESRYFDRDARLLLTPDGDTLLRSGTPVQRQACAALPRALRPADLDCLLKVLRQHAGRPMQEVQAAVSHAAIPASAIAHLFDSSGLREAQVEALPPAQRDALRAAWRDAVRPDRRPARREPAGLPPPDPPGIPSGPAVRPGATGPQPSRMAAEVTRGSSSAGRDAAVEPSSPAAGQASTDRMAGYLVARDLIVQGRSFDEAARRIQRSVESLHKFFTPEGRLLVTQRANALLRCNDQALRRAFEALPRALRPADLEPLVDALSSAPGTPGEKVRNVAGQGKVAEPLKAFLFDTDGLRAEALRQLPQEQSAALLKALSRGDPAGGPRVVRVPQAPPAIDLGRRNTWRRLDAMLPREPVPQPQPAVNPGPRGVGRRPQAMPPPASPPQVAQPAQAPAVAGERPLRGTPPQEAWKYQQAQQMLAQGRPASDVAAHLGLTAQTLVRRFDKQGRLLVNRRGEQLLRVKDPALRASFEALPRALTHRDLALLAEVLQGHFENPHPDLRQAAIDAGLSSDAVHHLFDGGVGLDERLAALPEDQMNALLIPGAPCPNRAGRVPMQDAVAGMPEVSPVILQYRQAQQLLAAGRPVSEVAADLGLTVQTLTRRFDKEGRLLLNRRAGQLLCIEDEALRARFEALPRALGQGDLVLLADVLQAHLETPHPDLRQAVIDAGVSSHAVHHLFDGDATLDERLATLPEHQRNALLVPGAPCPPRARNAARPTLLARMKEAQQLIAAGMAPREAGLAVGVSHPVISSAIDARGRLILSSQSASLLRAPDPSLQAYFGALRRSLRRIDLTLLAFLLRENARDPVADLMEAASEMGVSRYAVDYLFEGGEFREDRLAALPEAQMRTLLAARADLPEEPAQEAAQEQLPGELSGDLSDAAPDEWDEAPTGLPPPRPDDSPTAGPGAEGGRPVRPARPPRVPQGARPAATAAPGRNLRMPGAGEITAVLHFFRDRAGPLAFTEAQQRFGLDAERLLHWLAQAGVREQEARAGVIPGPAVLWARLSPTGSQPPDAASPSDFDSFSAALQALLESPAPSAHPEPSADPAQTASRKRAAERAPEGEPDRVRARLGVGQDTVWTGLERRPRAPRLARAEAPWGRMPALASPSSPEVRDDGVGEWDGLPDPGPLTLDVLAYLEQPYLPDQHDEALDLSNLPSPSEEHGQTPGR